MNQEHVKSKFTQLYPGTIAVPLMLYKSTCLTKTSTFPRSSFPPISAASAGSLELIVSAPSTQVPSACRTLSLAGNDGNGKSNYEDEVNKHNQSWWFYQFHSNRHLSQHCFNLIIFHHINDLSVPGAFSKQHVYPKPNPWRCLCGNHSVLQCHLPIHSWSSQYFTKTLGNPSFSFIASTRKPRLQQKLGILNHVLWTVINEETTSEMDVRNLALLEEQPQPIRCCDTADVDNPLPNETWKLKSKSGSQWVMNVQMNLLQEMFQFVSEKMESWNDAFNDWSMASRNRFWARKTTLDALFGSRE